MDTPRYPGAMRTMHWLVAVLVLATWPLGMIIKFVRDDVKLDFYLLHESLGFLVLWLMLVRIGIRLTSRIPKSAATGSMALVAHTVHTGLYLMLIVMPVSGFLATNAHGFPLVWFGVVPVWSPVGKTPDIAPLLSTVHEWSAWILFSLFALHLAGVLFHHVLRRDDTLYKML
ncbi:cytochrome b [Pararhizobium antarcticum]|uniref:Cytochrome B n=1 Tax=Pararhizobium antarcticum TaxID=1798805 RepID=A0A657LT54_9HYPH|nr:cytochrome b [Pararhizobium antarcticum]OJF96220.1 cytochrome B [Rhizobium sp. 58]OJF97763.1 cytochrome B [Pararhizobium antarcticum]